MNEISGGGARNRADSGDRFDVVVIVGLPGVGKSTIGRRVAKRLEWTFVDLDAAIEERVGASVRDIFTTEGEDGFRNEETIELERRLEGPGPLVLSAGGGVVVRPRNRSLLARARAVIWMTAGMDELETRLRPRSDSTRSHRPLLDGDVSGTLRRLRDERSELYSEVASDTVDTSAKTSDEVVREIVEIVRRIESPSVEPRHRTKGN